MKLLNKKILIISPQAWGKIHVSKHHYAIELNNRGNTIYFLNPPDFNLKKGEVEISNCEDYSNINIVKHNPNFPWSVRFHSRFIFNVFMKFHVRKIIKQLKNDIDIVWCFDPNSYSNLKWFKAKFNIYHPVDPITRKDQKDVVLSADVLFSVSLKILSAFNNYEKPKYFINHGLGNDFVKQAENNLSKINDINIAPEKLKVGYVGNLLRKPVDRELFINIINDNKDMEFHLWGPYQSKAENISGIADNETQEFINKLINASNVIMEGTKTPKQLAVEIQNMDAFFLTYKLIKIESDRSNSHKLIEYLSTGKPILSIDIETYRNKDLIYMSPENEDRKLLDIFNKFKNNYSSFYSKELAKKRIQYAIDNSMKHQVDRVESRINKIYFNL